MVIGFGLHTEGTASLARANLRGLELPCEQASPKASASNVRSLIPNHTFLRQRRAVVIMRQEFVNLQAQRSG